MDQLLKNMDKKRISLVVLLDTFKAFDSIQHDNLLSKLHSLGVSDSTLAWFKSYLSSCKQVVRIGSVLSKPLPLTVSVAQGSILGPVLFMLSVDLLLSVLKKCCRNVSHCQQQQSCWGLCSPRRSYSAYWWNDSWVQTFHCLTHVNNSIANTCNCFCSNEILLLYIFYYCMYVCKMPHVKHV